MRNIGLKLIKCTILETLIEFTSLAPYGLSDLTYIASVLNENKQTYPKVYIRKKAQRKFSTRFLCRDQIPGH